MPEQIVRKLRAARLLGPITPATNGAPPWPLRVAGSTIAFAVGSSTAVPSQRRPSTRPPVGMPNDPFRLRSPACARQRACRITEAGPAPLGGSRPEIRQKQGAALDVQVLVALPVQPSTDWPGFAPNPRQFKRGSCGFRRLTAVSRRRTAAATNRPNPSQRCGNRLRKAKNPCPPPRRDFADVRISRPPHSTALPPFHARKQEGRSEEHTSELQSLRHLVCRLLL